ncbi:hypothetical protein FX985_06348 [Pseudomonas extremaustralis]|uniref:Uncharacterized protein n=1 Tax=Pseudomonas extremaustralis TaxID=359110 RepID=A0A5M9IWS2_9PSED|nr:hypothetical protein FX985_06348 [Pseudomonas extremaustralis]
MLDQRQQLALVIVRQALKGRGLEHLAAEAPLQRQFATVHLALHRQPVGQRCCRVLGLATALAGGYEQRRLIELAVELAQVVEGDARRGQPGEGRTGLGRPQIAQQAVAQALVGHGTQLLLDRFDRTRQLAIGLQADREQAGEPTDGAGQVEPIEQVFAAMAFELDQRGRLAAPTADHADQRGQQQVIDLGAIGQRRVLQQPAGLLGIEAGLEPALQVVLQAALGVVARQLGVAGLGLPVRQLRAEGACMGLQLPRPVLVGAGLVWQGLLAISLLQVLQQNAPGHAIDHQVVHHQQQALCAIGQADQRGTQQRALRQVEAALGFVTQCCQLSIGARVGLPQRRLRHRHGVGLLPAVALWGKTQAQGVVMVDQVRQGGVQPRRLQRLARGQQQ